MDNTFPNTVFRYLSLKLYVFKKELLKFVRPEPNLPYHIHDAEGLSYLQDFGLDSAIELITNSNTTFKTVYILFVLVTRISKQQPASYFIAQIIIVKWKSYFKIYTELVETFQNRVIQQ